MIFSEEKILLENEGINANGSLYCKKYYFWKPIIEKGINIDSIHNLVISYIKINGYSCISMQQLFLENKLNNLIDTYIYMYFL